MIPKEARPAPHKPLWYQQSSPFAACCWEECTRISPSSSLGTAHLSQPGGLTHPLEFDLRGALVLPPHACASSPHLYPQDDSTHSVISLCPLVAVSSPTHICGHSFLLILFTSSDRDFWVLPALDGQCTSSKKPPSDHGWDPVFSLWLQSKLPSSLNCLLSPATHPLSPNPPSAPTLTSAFPRPELGMDCPHPPAGPPGLVFLFF